MNDEPQRLRPSWKLVPVALLTAVLIYVLVGQIGEAEEFAEVLAGARWEWVLAVVGLSAVVVGLNGLRFKVVLGASGDRIRWSRAVQVVLTVWPLVLLVPAKANDLLRAAVLRDEVEPASCVGSVVAERFVDVQTLCVLGMVGCGLLGAWEWLLVLGGLWAGAWAVAGVTLANVEGLVGLPLVQRFEEKFRALFRGFGALRERPGYLLGAIGVSAAAWLVSMGALWLLVGMFGAEAAPEVILGLWPLALFVGMAPVTIGGLGTRDAVFVGLVAAAVGVGAGGQEALLAATFGYGVVMVLLPGVVGLPLMVKWLGVE